MDAPTRSHDVRVRPYVRTIALAVAVIVAATVFAIAGWGYWRVSSHAYAHIVLHDVSLKSDRQLYGDLTEADVVFRDALGTALATARVDKPLGIVSMVHPTVGDCRREERIGGAAWSACFDTQSRWQMTWVPHVRSARVRVGTCTI